MSINDNPNPAPAEEPPVSQLRPMGEHVPVPVSAAKEIGERYRKTQVAIVAWDPVSGLAHLTTWGKEGPDKVQAARLGEILTSAAGCLPALRDSYEDLPEPMREAVARIGSKPA